MSKSSSSSSSTIIDAITVANELISSQDTIVVQGAGKAYQSVAQSTGISVQDGADYLRNVLTIATAGIGVATSKLIATQDMKYAEIIGKIQDSVSKTVSTVKDVGVNAGQVLKNFPSGK